MKNAELKFEPVSVRAFSINFDFKSIVKEYGWLRTIWGYDIFLNRVPFLKSLVMANVIVWVVMMIVR